MEPSINVLGTALKTCSDDPKTGWFRDGCCNTDNTDRGVHTVCAVVDDAFLTFSSSAGNDLTTPRMEYNFPGLKAGDRWCLCASRWKQALEEGCAPPVDLEATHRRTLEIVELSVLEMHAL
ncbi:MAG: DUF2237 domain-containing protein [Candidatus Thermoplasmatota archaeon]|nr:DUF2237 domain-containing protein [Candidatus Thermoplasmatota archaeon]